MRRVATPLFVLFALPAFAFSADPAKPSPEQLDYFEKHVRPLLAEHCYSCHGDKKQRGGLRLDTGDGLRNGAGGSPVVSPGDPDQSRLVLSVRRTGDYPMPPTGELTKEQVAILEQWVKSGAAVPADPGTVKPDAAATHWAFQPLIDTPVPQPTNRFGSRSNPIDAFLDVKLAANDLTPAPPADKRTLARRVYFDLIGLPPTAAELDQFAADTDPQAYEKLIERLLASPHYGERWGRYWLDVARYADSKGYVFTEDRNYPYAYTYRDYVIRSFNEDKPFDRFVLEQLAADQLELGDDKLPLAAMGFLTVGRRFSNNIHDITDDRIDVVTRGLMGLTVSCARCHDHKYDPIPTADYYSLYGVFASSNEPGDLPQIGETKDQKAYEQYQSELGKLTRAVEDERSKRLEAKKTGVFALTGGTSFQPNERRLLNRADRNEINNLQRKVDQFKAKSPAAPPRAMVMVDNQRAAEPVVFLRGNPGNRGPKVPRQMPAVVCGSSRQPFQNGSGRLEMARAIASKENPLTARVFVNRVWMWHFGRPLVSTPSDFGIRSDSPTHPELLDWLATRFIQDGWSVKKLHKRIMTTAAYTRSSVTPPDSARTDPENRWLAHQNRRRHDFEVMRDSLLAVSGQLDPTVYGRSVDLFKPPFSKRRAVYGYVDRQNLPGTLRAFDFASPEQHAPLRFTTTVPQQALFLLNSPFAIDVARDIIKRMDVATATDPVERVNALYRAVLSRSPTAEESELATSFVRTAELSQTVKQGLTPWEQFAQVLLLSNEFAFAD